MKEKIAVIGNGGWGTTLALLLLKKGYEVHLWGAFPDYVQYLKEHRENIKFLPGISLPSELKHTADAKEALVGASAAVMAVPSQFMREVARRIKEVYAQKTLIVSVAKGIESESLKLMHQVLEEELEPLS